jgi:hypothetical protein
MANVPWKVAMMPKSSAWADFSRLVVRRGRRDLLVDLQESQRAIAALATVIDLAERRADLQATRWLKIESMRQRAAFEHALHHVVECISDGDDLLDELTGGDDRLLADILLGD